MTLNELLEYLTPRQQELAAADFAELVLPIFEAKYPNDDRPRKAIEAARSATMSKVEKREASDAAFGAAYVSRASDAYYASTAAHYAAAAVTSYTASYAAAYAYYAIDTANAASSNKAAMEQTQFKIAIEYILGERE